MITVADPNHSICCPTASVNLHSQFVCGWPEVVVMEHPSQEVLSGNMATFADSSRFEVPAYAKESSWGSTDLNEYGKQFS